MRAARWEEHGEPCEPWEVCTEPGKLRWEARRLGSARDALLVLDLLLHVLDRVARLHVQRDGLPRLRPDEDLHGVCVSLSREARHFRRM